MDRFRVAEPCPTPDPEPEPKKFCAPTNDFCIVSSCNETKTDDEELRRTIDRLSPENVQLPSCNSAAASQPQEIRYVGDLPAEDQERLKAAVAYAFEVRVLERTLQWPDTQLHEMLRQGLIDAFASAAHELDPLSPVEFVQR